MVMSINALVADVAMPRLLWSQNLAGGANVHWVEVLVQFQERYFV